MDNLVRTICYGKTVIKSVIFVLVQLEHRLANIAVDMERVRHPVQTKHVLKQNVNAMMVGLEINVSFKVSKLK